MIQDPSADIDFFLPPDAPPTPSGISPEVADNLAFDDPRRLRIVARTAELREAGLLRPDEVDKIRNMDDDEGLEAIVGISNDMLPVWFLDVGYKRSAAICKIDASGIDHRGRNTTWAGTGFLISKDILLTNYHILNSADVARSAQCIFNYQVDPDEHELKGERFSFDPDHLFVPCRELDFSFVWVKGEPGAKYAPIRFSRDYFKIGRNEVANIIQHPQGRYKQVVLQDNRISDSDEKFIHYVADTDHGSSGSAVFNNQWTPLALHHAWKDAGPGGQYKYYNEGIKFSAIATYLEALSNEEGDRSMVKDILHVIQGINTVTGYFGALGREASPSDSGAEVVEDIYKAESCDIDIGFWNLGRFGNRDSEKLQRMADAISEMNIDIWVFEESLPDVMQELAGRLRDTYRVDFARESLAPDSPVGKRTNAVLWNTRTVEGKKVKWPEEIDKGFQVRGEDIDALRVEGAEGEVFDCYPALFHFVNNSQNSGERFDFHLVPLSLKAFDGGDKRRRVGMAILAAAIQKMIKDHNADHDWVIGGDFNASLANEDFSRLISGGMTPLSAEDEQGGAFSYVKSPRSLIDYIFLSPNLAEIPGSKDYFIVARDKKIPSSVKDVNDRPPAMVRLSLKSKSNNKSGRVVRDKRPDSQNERGAVVRDKGPDGAPAWLREALSPLNLKDIPAEKAISREKNAEREINITVPLNITIKQGEVRISGRAKIDEARTFQSLPPISEDEEEAIRPDRDYSNRSGYDPDFLGFSVPLPKLTPAIRPLAVKVPGGSGAERYELKYNHYSVIMNGERRLAFVSAVNFDSNPKYGFVREKGGDKWFLDPRISEEFQAGEEFYSDNPLDRGHLSRRADAAWGDSKKEAKLANDDTFHFPNCSPQHEIFNQDTKANKEGLLLWGNLEKYVATQARKNNKKLSIFNGPIFRSNDPKHRGLSIPREFYKIIVFEKDGGGPRAIAFLLSQASLIKDLPEEEFVVGPYRPFQVRIRKMENETKLDFGRLRNHDPLEGEENESLFEERTEAVPLNKLEDIVL